MNKIAESIMEAAKKVKIKTYLHRIDAKKNLVDMEISIDAHNVVLNDLPIGTFKVLSYKLGVQPICELKGLTEDEARLLWNSTLIIKRSDGSSLLRDYPKFINKFADEEEQQRTDETTSDTTNK